MSGPAGKDAVQDNAGDKVYVESVLSHHAQKLLSAFRLHDLAFFAANLQDYELVGWLRKERYVYIYLAVTYSYIIRITLCLNRNVPTLASCSFDKQGLILILFGKQRQHTFINDVPIQLSLSLHFYLFYLLLNSSIEYDAMLTSPNVCKALYGLRGCKNRSAPICSLSYTHLMLSEHYHVTSWVGFIDWDYRFTNITYSMCAEVDLNVCRVLFAVCTQPALMILLRRWSSCMLTFIGHFPSYHSVPCVMFLQVC